MSESTTEQLRARQQAHEWKLIFLLAETASRYRLHNAKQHRGGRFTTSVLAFKLLPSSLFFRVCWLEKHGAEVESFTGFACLQKDGYANYCCWGEIRFLTGSLIFVKMGFEFSVDSFESLVESLDDWWKFWFLKESFIFLVFLKIFWPHVKIFVEAQLF